MFVRLAATTLAFFLLFTMSRLGFLNKIPGAFRVGAFAALAGLDRRAQCVATPGSETEKGALLKLMAVADPVHLSAVKYDDMLKVNMGKHGCGFIGTPCGNVRLVH